MKIRQFRYGADNFSYLVYGKKAVLVIDGGAVDAIFSFIKEHNLQIEYVVNTHSHPDHTMGTKTVLDRSGAVYLDNKTLRKNKSVQMEGQTIPVYHTPGHTEDSVCFHVDNMLITGDTLFNGTIGNCFSGNLDGFLKSIKLLMAFPDETIVYAGHDYVRDSMVFAKYLESDNKDIDIFLKAYDPNHVRSTLLDERKINPYVRFNDENIIAVLVKKGLPVNTEDERWKSLMSIE